MGGTADVERGPRAPLGCPKVPQGALLDAFSGNWSSYPTKTSKGAGGRGEALGSSIQITAFWIQDARYSYQYPEDRMQDTIQDPGYRI